jgi:uncharacterized protein (DUF2062 family)
MFGSRQKRQLSQRVAEFIWPRSGLKRAWLYLVRRMARAKASPHRIAIGFAAGAFASFTPFIGLHFVLAALVAWILRGNLVASAIGTVVGNPLTFPFIWMASYQLGVLVTGVPTADEPTFAVTLISTSPAPGAADGWLAPIWQSVGSYVGPMLLGGIPLGLVCGAISYFLVLAAIRQLKSLRRPSDQTVSTS